MTRPPSFPRNLTLVLGVLGIAFFGADQTARAAPPARKVAVIMNLGDPSILGASLAADQKKAEETYRRLGYEIIVLSNDATDPTKQATRTNLRREMDALKGVSDFELDLLGHGRVQDAADVPIEDKERFPVIRHSPAEKKAGSSLADFSKEKVYVAVSVTDRQLAYADPHGPEANRAIFSESIGTGDLRAAIKGFRENNPGVRTTLHMLNCFGASLGQGLADIDGVQVFNATENSKTAIQYHDPKMMGPQCRDGKLVEDGGEVGTLNYMNQYYDAVAQEIASGKKPGASYDELHRKVAQKMLDDLLPVGKVPIVETIDLPRSSTQNHLIRWCEEHPGVPTNSDGEDGGAKTACSRDPDGDGTKETRRLAKFARKVGLSQILKDANSISAQAADRLDDLLKRYCSNPSKQDPDGSIKSADKAALKSAKQKAESNALAAVDRDLATAESLLPLSSPEGKRTRSAHAVYSKTLARLNSSRAKIGLLPYTGVSEVPDSEPSKSELSKQWWDYQTAWRAALNKNPLLKKTSEEIKTALVNEATATLESDRKMKIERRSIAAAERAVFRAKNEFDWVGMIEDAKSRRCALGGDCAGVGKPAKSDGTPQDTLSALLAGVKRFSSEPGQDAEALGKDCVQKLHMPTSHQPGSNSPGGGTQNGPPSNPSGGGPNGGGTAPNPCAPGAPKLPSLPSQTPQSSAEIHAENLKLLACVENASVKEPYAAALALLNSANLTKDTDGRCAYWRSNRDLYRGDLACADRFGKGASDEDLRTFLDAVKLGQRKP